MKIETHLHTMENDLVVEKKAPQIVEDYYNSGYTGIVVTNHYFNYASTWFPELENCSSKQYADYFLQGYRAAKIKGDMLGMTILLGMELRFSNSRNDYLVYGLTEDFFYNAPVLYTLDLEKFRNIMPKNARIYQAHPFRLGLSVANTDLLDGIEVYNGGNTGEKRNKLAECYATIFEKNIISGTDYHHPNQVGKGGIICNSQIKTQNEFIDLLDSQNYKLIKDGVTDETL